MSAPRLVRDRIHGIVEEGSCDWCGCPQDSGDVCYRFEPDGALAFCSKSCARHHAVEEVSCSWCDRARQTGFSWQTRPGAP
jgi:hypothetical protein